MSSYHEPLQCFCILINLLLVIVTVLVALTALGHQYDFPEAIPHLLRHDLQGVADRHPSPISPAAWIHWAWAVVLIWQVTWSLHGLISICRKTMGVPVYTSPVLLSSVFLVIFMFGCGFNVAWFILYDREYTSTSSLFMVLMAVALLLAYTLSTNALNSNIFRLRKSERHTEIWLTTILVQNGLALYFMWCVFVMAFNISVALMYSKTALPQNTATIIGMSIIAFVLVTYLITDVTWLDRYSRYVITPYIVPIVVLVACLCRQGNWRSDDVNFLFLASLLCFAFVSLMVKSAFVACRTMRPISDGGEISSTYQYTPKDEAHYLLK